MQRRHQLLGRVRRGAIVRPVGAGDVLRLGDTPHVVAEQPVGIVEKTHDDVEAGEVLGPLRGKRRAAREEPGEGARLKRPDPVGHARDHGQRRGLRISEHLEMRVGKRTLQRREHGHREDEIAERPAADDEDTSLPAGRVGFASRVHAALRSCRSPLPSRIRTA